MGNLIPISLLAAVSGFIFAARKRIGLFWSSVLFFVSVLLYLEFGMTPSVPDSIVVMTAGTGLIAMLLYVTSSEANREAFWGPIRSLIVDPRRRVLLGIVMLAVPSAVAWQVYNSVLPTGVPPPKTRSLHPPPPGTVKFNPPGGGGREVDVIKEDSPFAEIQASDPELYEEKVALGKKVYYENCYYCHGDNLAADGHYADALSFPPPASFRDPGVIPSFQNTFWFWRIAKGGLGLPDEGTPWDTAMPVWERYLNEDEVWAVILFMSDFTGFTPRQQEEVH